jgi:hypothetical protein
MPLPGFVVDVQQAALGPRVGRGLGLVDRGGHAMDMQHAGEREPAEARADDVDARVGREGRRGEGVAHGAFRFRGRTRRTRDGSQGFRRGSGETLANLAAGAR